MSDRYDVVVVGGGHAGCEAAAAAARAGARAALITLSPDTIGAMSCNPAIGGMGKGQLVREIDALDGLMGRAADAAGIQFRMLNRRKGPAVRGPRAQADRKLYRQAIQTLLEQEERLDIIAGEVCSIDVRGGVLQGVSLVDGRDLTCAAVVLTTGTFLRGLIHIGERTIQAGRINEPAAMRLSASLAGLGLRLGRLKTGTPPRLDGRTIDWAALDMQAADAEPVPFSLMSARIDVPQIACGITRTTAATHSVIRDNIHRSAMYSGAIKGTGPRYCPSIEDKIVRFGERDGHQIFLEPEGLDDTTIYPNGISTSLPEDVQEAIVASIPGLERCRIIQHGYAIEYDHVDPRELDPSFELRAMPGLFLAGQINGTTGYEEAAAQGIVAGLNAARRAGGSDPVLLDRTQAYVGVMADDLTTFGVSEPYRMFTSRAEFRLSIRADNADARLTPLGHAWGMVRADRWARFSRRQEAIDAARAQLQSATASPSVAARAGVALKQDGVRRSAYELLAYPDIEWDQVRVVFPDLGEIDRVAVEAIEIEAKYAVYLDRQKDEANRLRTEDGAALDAVDYSAISGLSSELRAKLSLRHPRTLGEARRIEGMTPAALMLLMAASGRMSRNRNVA